MRGWQRLWLAVWLTALVPGVAAAASLFDLPSGDQSVARLVAPFAGDTTSGQIATLFGGLNAAILFLGSLVAGYGILSGIAQTAHDGEMLGRRFSSLWVPIRVAIGLAAIVPLGNGLCGAQMVVNHVAQMGIGVGANIWSQYVANASPEDSEDYVLPDLSGVRDLALGRLAVGRLDARARRKDGDRRAQSGRGVRTLQRRQARRPRKSEIHADGGMAVAHAADIAREGERVAFLPCLTALACLPYTAVHGATLPLGNPRPCPHHGRGLYRNCAALR